MLFLIGTAQAQKSLLTQEQKDEISRRAIAEAENDSIYLAPVVKRALDSYHIGAEYKPEAFMSLARSVFSSDDAESKAKILSKFANKVITKGKPASDKDKELWKPCYAYYLSSIYLKEAEQIAIERKKREEYERKKREEYEKDYIRRNNWNESNLWNALQEVCGRWRLFRGKKRRRQADVEIFR